eukprot:3645719-Prymnesium_polylepis.1
MRPLAHVTHRGHVTLRRARDRHAPRAVVDETAAAVGWSAVGWSAVGWSAVGGSEYEVAVR